MAYLDNNATTVMSPATIKEMVLWCNKGNPSADYASAKSAREMIDVLRKKIQHYAGADYDIIFGSGASEANATMIHNVICMYTKPHILYSAIEHKSIIDCVNKYAEIGLCTAGVVPATRSGHILPDVVSSMLTRNTKLVCVMYANNEIGSINDIKAIGQIVKANGSIFHCDTVQTFGKIPKIPSCVDSFCVSFHKLAGPPGVGCLAIKPGLLQVPLIAGSQNNSQRGGTENTPGLAASLHAVSLCMENRAEKNNNMLILKKIIYDDLVKFGAQSYKQYKKPTSPKPIIIFLTGIEPEYFLPNTILLSVVSTKHNICNAKLKKALATEKIIISVGSACNTSSAKASHVLYSIGADQDIRKGALRISLADATTKDEVKYFTKKFIEVISKL
jgi:cysteine desulfurase